MQNTSLDQTQVLSFYMDTKEQVKHYWTARSVKFSELRMEELNSPLADKWMREIEQYIPEGQDLKILDVGTGAGFFAILLSSLGHRVIGVDLTPSMIEEARKINEEMNQGAEFYVMDAEHLSFADESFDLVITRNLTWTLPNAAGAYREWQRVLKKGGSLLNFDANYGAEDLSGEQTELPLDHAHKEIGEELNQECDRIRNQMAVSFQKRPAWDIDILGNLGFEKIQIDTGISKRVYDVVDKFYNPTPMFSIAATKE